LPGFSQPKNPCAKAISEMFLKIISDESRALVRVVISSSFPGNFFRPPFR
jgi:hypothetical protein